MRASASVRSWAIRVFSTSSRAILRASESAASTSLIVAILIRGVRARTRSITWATAYGVTLTIARVIGEYGAVLIVSGNIGFRTETLTLNISNNFENFTPYQGFVGVSLLSLVSIFVLLVLGHARHRERLRHEYRT